MFALLLMLQTATVPVFSPGVYSGVLNGTGTRPVHYAISIPQSYSGSAAVPLVLALHFSGEPMNAGRSLLNVLVRPALSELGAIIVAPDSSGGAWDTAENDRAVNLLLDAVVNSYNIDKSRIVVTGFSMGGAGAWHFADKYPSRFSAAIPVSGRPAPFRTDWRVPVFAVHSRDDQVVPIGPAEARITELRKIGVPAEIVALSGISHYETGRFVDGLRKAVPWLRQIWNR